MLQSSRNWHNDIKFFEARHWCKITGAALFIWGVPIFLVKNAKKISISEKCLYIRSVILTERIKISVMNTDFEMSDAIYDYLVVVNPDALVAQDITNMRDYVGAAVGDATMVGAPVHIALFRSAFPERFQEDFVLMLEETARRQSGFLVYTAKIDAHQHSDGNNSVYINIANPKPLIDLHKSILGAFELKPQHFKPHILLARGVGNVVSGKLMASLSQQMFVRSFNCHCFSLMRRPAEGGKYEKVRDFVFGDVEHLPGSLFINNYAA